MRREHLGRIAVPPTKLGALIEMRSISRARALEGEITDLEATGFNRQYPTRFIHLVVVLQIACVC